ncbi:MAG: prohibitin family protein [Treponema sp.]|nr:prohibitin family protein [Treponema sp.]
MQKEGNIVRNVSKSFVTTGIIILLIVIILANSFSVISPNERGVVVELGQIKEGVVQPGVKAHIPFISRVRKFRLEPKTYEVTFTVGGDGAITRDMQTVGATVAVRYIYDENRIMDIVTRYYNDTIIQSAMKDNVKASLKETTGKYSIYELVEQQNKITAEVADAMLTRMADYPIAISQTTITNWDWSEDFDRQIKETANRTQQVKQAEQEANIAAAQAQKLVKEAEAKKQAAELDAQAAVAKAQGEADAERIKADAQAYTNRKISENYSVMKAQWDYEIELERAKRWNGKEVPEAAYVVPGTGAVVPLKTN